MTETLPDSVIEVMARAHCDASRMLGKDAPPTLCNAGASCLCFVEQVAGVRGALRALGNAIGGREAMTLADFLWWFLLGAFSGGGAAVAIVQLTKKRVRDLRREMYGDEP